MRSFGSLYRMIGWPRCGCGAEYEWVEPDRDEGVLRTWETGTEA